MGLYLVERNVSAISPDRIRTHQRALSSACSRLSGIGKRVRYINSAVVPTDGRAIDVFGAESTEAVKEIQAVAQVPYERIVEVLDLTPSFLSPLTSRSRRPAKKGIADTMSDSAPAELMQWLSEGQRFFSLCQDQLARTDHLEAKARTLEAENEMLREEMARLRHRVDMLQTDRSEMVAAFNDLAGHVTQVVDHILQKSENGEETK